ncbi:rhodanese-like domain-containing protein [Pseudogracilibacillus auburnensis]|uniref:rhodanese-like domain-containing protein n=1 Tax=Pseudogracilibacillus auburnensis TaxID=1494959 RepID=UPI001A97D08E|nr:rhodanese-like domain-containing protein [Pseudogracilibacillus auburnensis]MBO1003983.1 rhodanese-like domain-containing protein [Pseudogracilibacillus auburnensis]
MKEYTAEEVVAKLKNGETLHLIDVREVDEVVSGKIPGALHIPLGLLEFRLHELDKKIEYVMVCRSGGRSGTATRFLNDRGFNAINMRGGMLDWHGEIE